METSTRSHTPLQRLDGTPVRVLVVDDEPNLTELLSMALRYEGWDVKTAATGSQAIRQAKEFRPDAVVLDMMLPDFDGLTVLRRMRQENAAIPVLFLTAKVQAADRRRFTDLGIQAVLVKPFDPLTLSAQVANALGWN